MHSFAPWLVALALGGSILVPGPVALAQEVPPPAPPPPAKARPGVAPPRAPNARVRQAPPRERPPDEGAADADWSSRGRRSFFRRGGYVALGFGVLGFLNPDGAFERVSPGGGSALYVGIDILPWVTVEIGAHGLLHQESWSPDGSLLGLWFLTFDLKLRPPGRTLWRRHFVPYLLLGLGGGGLIGRDETLNGDLRTGALASGISLQAGFGGDVFLSSRVFLGIKLMYRGLFVKSIRCERRGCPTQPDGTQVGHGLGAEVSLGVRF